MLVSLIISYTRKQIPGKREKEEYYINVKIMETIRYLADKLWMMYAQRIMKWNWMLVTKNKEGTEIISLVFCDSIELGGYIKNTIDDYALSKEL